MKILIACEYSGVVRDAFRVKGHDAWSCDLLPSDADPKFHIQGDVREVLNDGWDLMIAHPECTYIANSGVHHLHKDPARWKSLYEACEFFKLLINAPIPKICVENPIPHKYGLGWIGKKYSQIIQPWMFGHTEKKATCLWLKGIPKLTEEKTLKQKWSYYRKTNNNDFSIYRLLVTGGKLEAQPLKALLTNGVTNNGT